MIFIHIDIDFLSANKVHQCNFHINKPYTGMLVNMDIMNIAAIHNIENFRISDNVKSYRISFWKLLPV